MRDQLVAAAILMFLAMLGIFWLDRREKKIKSKRLETIKADPLKRAFTFEKTAPGELCQTETGAYYQRQPDGSLQRMDKLKGKDNRRKLRKILSATEALRESEARVAEMRAKAKVQ